MTEGSDGAISISMIESSGGLGGRSGMALCLLVGALKLLLELADLLVFRLCHLGQLLCLRDLHGIEPLVLLLEFLLELL